MAQNSKIEWCNHTANLWHGCTKVHTGCDNCYAEVLSHRWRNDIWGNDKPRKEIKSVWSDLLKYQKLAKESGQIHRVFVGSMMDIFEKSMPLIDSKGNEVQGKDTGWLRDLFFQHISNGIYPNLMFLLLTKRPSNINKYIPESWKKNPPDNVMFGTSPVDEETCNKLIPQLLKVNGKRFLSIEPQLDEITFRWRAWVDDQQMLDLYGKVNHLDGLKGVGWLIQGGESGHHKRPFNTDWARMLRDQCAEANVPYFFKQIDKIQPIPEDLMVRQFPNLKNKNDRPTT